MINQTQSDTQVPLSQAWSSSFFFLFACDHPFVTESNCTARISWLSLTWSIFRWLLELIYCWLFVDCLLTVCWLFVDYSWIVSWLSVDYASPVAIRMNGISQVFSSSSAWSIPALCCPTSNRLRHDIHDSRHRKTKETCSSDQWPVPLCMDDYQCYPRTSMDVVLTMNVFMIDVRHDNAALTKPLPAWSWGSRRQKAAIWLSS